MKTSWNYKEFFKVNNKVGQNEKLDFAMYFASSWLIYVISAIVILWGYFKFNGSVTFWFMFLALGISIFFGLIASFTISLFWSQKRPIAVLKDIKQLIIPFQTWKSFPSDHTLISFLFALMPLYFGASFFFVLALFLLSAVVGYGRVYVGVHYPYDIFGGFLLALIISPLSFFLTLILVF
ncbi:MAG: phosphatase PAP2 family protein [Candidatus Magasanikbacteria bacterium]|nr:phosphatase PAP2 family protein [Candidatus Magasanikbacteria bacterium]